MGDDKLKYTCENATHGMISLHVGDHAKTGDSYIFCMTPEEAKKNTKDFEQGLITVREVPVVKKSTKVEIVYAEEILKAYAGTANFNYKAMAEALVVERKEFDDQIVSQVVAGAQQSVIDYDKLAVSLDRHIAGADADPSFASVLPMLVLIFTAVGYLMMFIKQARGESKRYTEALEKVLQKWDASSDKDDTGSTSKKTEGCSSDETSVEEQEEDDSDDSDDRDNSKDSEVEITATTNTTKSVPTFTEYVHGKAKPRSTKQEPTTTSGATASPDKAKVVGGDLSGFKNPAERELVEDMLIDAMVDIMEHGDRVSLQYRESLRAPEARKKGLDLVNKICAKGKQYTDKAKRVAGIDGSTHALEKKYKDTLDRDYNAGASSGRSGAKDDDKKRVDSKAASTSADCTAKRAMHTEAHTTTITVVTTVTAAGKAPTITTNTFE